MNPADLAEVRQVIRSELHLLQREALPATLQTRVSEALELRAVERFNLTSRTKLTLNDVTPAASSFLTIDANGFATYATVTGGSGATISRGTLAARPTAAVLGSGNVYYTTDTFQLVRSNGATYDEIGLEDIFQATGDLVAGASADTPVRFPVGTNGQCIIADSTAVGIGLRYVGLGSVTGQLVKAQSPLTTKGDLWVTDGTNMHRLPAGTDGQALLALAAATDGLQWAGLATITGALVKAQSPLTTKGDLWVTDGASMHRLGIGTDNQVLGALAAAADGLNWIGLGSITGSIVKAQTPLTTKGDLLTIDGTTLHRLGIGSNGLGLTPDSTLTDGVKWGYPVGHYEQQQALNGATLNGLPRCNMVREAIQNDVASTFAFGVMSVVGIWLEAGLVISRIGIINGATAGAGLTNRWAAIYTPGGAALGRQSTSVATATTTANTWIEFTLSATYTTLVDGYFIIGVTFAGATTAPTARGGGLGNAIVGNPTGATGVTFPFVAGSNGAGLTTTAPAGPLTITAQGRQFAVWVY